MRRRFAFAAAGMVAVVTALAVGLVLWTISPPPIRLPPPTSDADNRTKGTPEIVRKRAERLPIPPLAQWDQQLFGARDPLVSKFSAEPMRQRFVIGFMRFPSEEDGATPVVGLQPLCPSVEASEGLLQAATVLGVSSSGTQQLRAGALEINKPTERRQIVLGGVAWRLMAVNIGNCQATFTGALKVGDFVEATVLLTYHITSRRIEQVEISGTKSKQAVQVEWPSLRLRGDLNENQTRFAGRLIVEGELAALEDPDPGRRQERAFTPFPIKWIDIGLTHGGRPFLMTFETPVIGS